MLQSTRKSFELIAPTHDTTCVAEPSYSADFGDTLEGRGMRVKVDASRWAFEHGTPNVSLSVVYTDNMDSSGYDSNCGMAVVRHRSVRGMGLPELRKFIDELDAVYADAEAMAAHYAKKKADKEKE